MGNNKEPSIEQSAPQIEDEMGEGSETNSSLEQEVSQAEDGKLLNTYKWHTGAKNETPRAMERFEKEASVKWNKMQNWRKSLSEDAAEKISTSTQRVDSLAKLDKPIRKNPFRRALSEPAGSLLSSVLSSSSSASSSGQTSGSTAQDTAQKGKLRKYLLNVSQKFKRVCLQSSSIPEHETDNCQSENVVQNTARLSWAPPQDVFVWDISSISLQDGQICISPEEDPILMRNQTSSGLFNQSLQNISVSHVELNPDPVVPQSSGKVKGQDGGVKGLIKRRLQNDDKRKSSTQLNTAGLIATGRIDSRESLAIPVVAAKSLDLSADQSTVIRPVHSSILGEKYCFQVINSENNHCFGCSSAAERDRWIEDLRRTAHPNKDNCERTECSLSLWINEAKDLFPKKRYYCEIHLDGTLFARTSSRAVGKSSQVVDGGSPVAGPGHHSGVSGGCHLFWGEFFELDNLPPVTQITLHLFKDEDPKKKRFSKDDSVLHPLGSVALALADIKGRAYQEKWFPIVPYRPVGVTVLKDQVGSQASLRVKAKFQKLNVLPIERYKEFAEYVTLNYVEMCSSLEPLLNVREKEELAVALVHVLQSIGKAKEFLIELGSAEVQRLGENEALIFRENTLVTKAIDEYMKLVGQKYLIDTLGDFISRLYSVGESCEVDPLKCSASDLTINQRHLKETCGDVVKRITDMQDSFPAELNDIFSNWVSDCEERGLQDIGHRLISATLFLRFLCPAILSPSLFRLTQPYPEPNTLRTLTLTAKVIQNLANFTLFGDKEEYMLFMNEFLEQHWETMRAFLQRVSNSDPDMPMARFDGYVDLPLRLAVLHNILVDKISVMNQNQIDNLCPLPSILNQITEFLGEDVQLISVSSSGTPKPTYIPPKDLPKYSPLHNSMQQLPVESKTFQVRERQRKQVQRAFSVPNRPNRHPRQSVKRQASNEELPSQDQEMLQDPPIVISSPTDQSSKSKVPPAPVPWIKQLESSQITQVQEEANPVNKKTQELAELHLAMDQMAERELDMAKRLEDFIVQSQEKNEQLQADIQELRNLLAIREEQLASATFRLGVIEEEREEDERKLTVAVAAVERMNVLEEQFAGLLKDVHQLYAVNSDDIRKAFINN